MAGDSPAEIWRKRDDWEQSPGAMTVGSLDPNWDIEQKHKLGRLMYSLIIGAGAGAAASGAGGAGGAGGGAGGLGQAMYPDVAGGAAGGAAGGGAGGGGGMFAKYLNKMGTGGPFGHGEAGPSFGSGFGNAMWQLRGGGGGYGDTKAPPAVGPQTGPAAGAGGGGGLGQAMYPDAAGGPMAAPPAVGQTDFGRPDPMALSPQRMQEVQGLYDDKFLGAPSLPDMGGLSPGPKDRALPLGAPSLQDPMAMSPGAMEQLQREFGPPSDDQERMKQALFLISLLKGR
jgi:hypothetical protein